MCKYVVIRHEDDDAVVHTECGYLLSNNYVLSRLLFPNCRCEFCGEVIEYGS